MDRFWSKVDVKEPNECWEWQRGTIKRGKTRVGYINRKTYGESVAPRYAFLSYNGYIKKELCVLHHCDNPLCCNPKHLYLGTPKDNAKDMVLRKRHAKQQVTHCPRNHEYNEKTTRWDKKGNRYCVACKLSIYYERKALRCA